MSTSNTLFNPLSVPCTCEGLPEQMCVCAAAGGAEKCLRYVMAVDGVLSTEQREWCLNEIDHIEGHSRADHEADSHADLARATLDAWTDYARDQGLL